MDRCSLSPAPAPPSFFASHIQDLNAHAIRVMHQGDFVGAHISLNHAIELLELQDSEEQQGEQDRSSTHCGAPSLQLVVRDSIPTAPVFSPNHYTPSSASLAHQTLFHKAFAIVYHADSHPGLCSRCGGAGATTSSQGTATTTRTHEESETFVLLWLAVLLYNRGLCQQLLALFVGPAHENGTYFKAHMQKALFSYETALNILETLVFLYREQHQEDEEDEEEGCFCDNHHERGHCRGGGGQEQEKQQRFLELALLNNCTYLYSCGVVTECDCQVQAEMFLHRIADCIQQTVEESEQDSAPGGRAAAGRLDQECVMDAPTRNVFWANANVCFELLRQQHKQASAAA